jgi:hypothetical protein
MKKPIKQKIYRSVNVPPAGATELYESLKAQMRDHPATETWKQLDEKVAGKPAAQMREHTALKPMVDAINDMVNHPPHYNAGKIETIDVIEDIGQHYESPVHAILAGNVIKYISRAPLKGDYLESLKKAQWYLNRLVAKAESEQ